MQPFFDLFALFIEHIQTKKYNKAFYCSRAQSSKECMIEYIDLLHKQYKPKSAKRKIACIKAFYHYMEMENTNPFVIWLTLMRKRLVWRCI